MTGCSAPASEAALVRRQGGTHFANSLAAATLGGADEQKARAVDTPRETRADEPFRGRCPQSMVDIEGRFCIDRYEATLMDVLSNGEERAHSPFTPVIDL